MSLIRPGTPPSVPARKNMFPTRRPFNWRISVLVVFVVFGLKLWFHIYRGSPIDNPMNNLDVEVDNLVPDHVVGSKSPLQELIRSEVSFHSLSDNERAILFDIENKAALDIKFFAIPEIVYARNDKQLLCNYVENQLKSARDVITRTQGAFVLKLTESGVAQGSMMKKELGDKGSLKNSIVIAFMREEEDNLHFAMVAVSVEPRLGWRLITKKQRNEWNDVLSRVADARLKQELDNLFVNPTKRVSEDEHNVLNSSAYEQLSL